jgi:hypothetical protein
MSVHQIDVQIRKIQTLIADQEARLQRMTLQGFPTQSATDSLNIMCADLQAMRREREESLSTGAGRTPA